MLLVFLVSGVVFGIGLTTGLDDAGIGWQLGTRFASLGVAGGLAAGWSRWIGPTGSSALLSLTRRDLLAALGFVLSLAALGALEAEVQNPAPRSNRSTLPARLPINITGPTVDGGEFRSSEFLGQVILVDFWSTNCGPCLRELPNVQALYDAYHGDGLEVVGISLDEDRQELVKFLKAHPHPWRQVNVEGAGWHSPLAKRYDVHSIPRIMVVDRKGNLAADDVLGTELEAAVQKALGPDVPNRRAIPTGSPTVWGRITAAIHTLRTWLLLSFLRPPWIVTTVSAVCGAALLCSVDRMLRKGRTQGSASNK